MISFLLVFRNVLFDLINKRFKKTRKLCKTERGRNFTFLFHFLKKYKKELPFISDVLLIDIFYFNPVTFLRM